MFNGSVLQRRRRTSRGRTHLALLVLGLPSKEDRRNDNERRLLRLIRPIYHKQEKKNCALPVFLAFSFQHFFKMGDEIEN
jgi:hypothetical protein